MKNTNRRLLNFAAIAKIFNKTKLMRLFLLACSFVIATVFAMTYTVPGTSQTTSLAAACVRPPAGSVVVDPPEINYKDEKNPVNLAVLNVAPGQNCYLADGSLEAPTIRVKPGKKDLVIKLTDQLPGSVQAGFAQCAGGIIRGMPPQNSTNLHYHGLNISPACGQDEVVSTVIQPTESFTYKIEIPKKEPPGMYWYHPHIHMQSERQVLSGLTGAIIVEGIKKYNKQAAKLPERVFVLRDLDLSSAFPESDTAQPQQDISINSVPIRYLGNGRYDPPAVIQMDVNEKQFWRVANTAANTYFDLQVTYDGTPQQLDLVAMDGVPIAADGSKPKDHTISVKHILLAPAGRAEFMVNAPSAAVKDAKLLSLNVIRGADNNPQRAIAKIVTQSQLISAASSPKTPKDSELNADESAVSGDRFSGISEASPVQQRTLYFSQTPPDAPKEEFYITVEGDTPKPYQDFTAPAIRVAEGTTEDWIVQNRSSEAHVFHIHQIHFLVLASPDSSDLGMVRDTISIPGWNGAPNTPYPQVRMRMDFRGVIKDTSIAGTFLYHCHILEHEDGGMMAPIEVIAAK